MSLKATVKKSYPPVKTGTYPAICVCVIDLGHQMDKFSGKEKERLLLTFEIPSQTIEVDGEQKSRWVSWEVTNTLDDRGNLKPILEACMRGEVSEQSFDVSNLLGRCCLASIGVKQGGNGNSYNRVTGVMALPEGMEQLTTANELLLFDFDHYSEEALAALPEWVQKRVKESREYREMHTPEEAVDFPDEEEVPF
ncbi:MAG: hypothetical protein LUD83_09095 [Clostridiales bacterium]|nr:hypothetical protein [Clostridiales bacterium]